MLYSGAIVLLIIGVTFTPAAGVTGCSSDAECSSLAGAVCSAGRCSCPPGQQAVAGGTSCVPSVDVTGCSSDAECSGLAGAVCSAGRCSCPPGQQAVAGGTSCVPFAPYHTSECVEDHQCSRLQLAFHCRRNNESDAVGACHCQPGYHFYQGRCWQTAEYGQTCTQDRECFSVDMGDPEALVCQGTCQCADNYYLRQRGECRRIAYAVGEGCVLDEDCQFEGGACNIQTFSCYDTTVGNMADQTQSKALPNSTTNKSTRAALREHGAECSMTSPCPEPLECGYGVCLCPVGYYFQDGLCMAEFGSPSTAEQCTGLLATVVDGVCRCPNNFFYDENMRDCVKVTRTITESCVTDANCRTFGSAARCGPEQPPWGVRTCECVPEQAVWEQDRQMCRLFAGVGEFCEVDSDCLAGDLEIQCSVDDQGVGVCACPEGFAEADGLCLTTGLDLGDACQATLECTVTPNTVCSGGFCSCDPAGYVEVDGYCAPVIGGTCVADGDCVIESTYCADTNGTRTCRCTAGFLEHDNACWPVLTDIDSHCNETAQCQQLLGAAGVCADRRCGCISGHHYRDGACWPYTGLFETCARTSQCYLADVSERVVCRNSMCQCDFDYPYSEELQTCVSSAAHLLASFLTVVAAVALLSL